MRSCHRCALFDGEDRKVYSRCKDYEVEDGFVKLREYIRPESTEKKPCPAWRAKRREPGIKPGAAEPYDWHDHIYEETLKEERE